MGVEERGVPCAWSLRGEGFAGTIKRVSMKERMQGQDKEGKKGSGSVEDGASSVKSGSKGVEGQPNKTHVTNTPPGMHEYEGEKDDRLCRDHRSDRI
jgi:hypothetical protein